MTRSPRVTCPRCGRERYVNISRRSDLCRDCWYVEPDWPHIFKQVAQ